MPVIIPVVSFLLTSFVAVLVDGKNYHVGDKVDIFVNKIGPYANKHETYHYFQLPLCRPLVVVHRSLSLGQLLNGDRMAESSFLVHFGQEQGRTSVCGRNLLSEKDLEDLTAAVEDNFYFELIVDSMPVHNFLGFVDEQNTFPHTHRTFLYTYFTFIFYYNRESGEIYKVVLKEDRNAVLNLTAKPKFLELTYSVEWKAAKYLERQDRDDEEFFAAQAKRVQWTAILNSALLVFLLVSLVVWILRSVIKRDLSRYNADVYDDFANEDGWKSISTDVFRLPKFRIFFASIIGVGSQFLFLITLVLIIGSTQLINARNHETLNSVAVLLYAVTSGIAGFVSAYIYRQFDGWNWISNANLTTSLFTAPMILIWMLNNSISWAYGSTQALPYTTVIVIALIWLCVGYPLTVVGASIGKNFATSYTAPCRTRNVPRQLPHLPCHKTDFSLMLVGGFLPFSAMSVEFYYIFSTVWGHESYTIYYLLLIVLLITIVVVATSSISLIYVKLSSEDYRWWWTSIFIGGSVGFFVFVYGIYFYIYRSNMSGLLQTVQYFSHLFLLCYIFFLTMATVSFVACHRFIRFIYSIVKTD